MKRLEWGQTPWDNKSREELLFNVKQMYGALTALNSVCALVKAGSESSPFWNDNGVNMKGSGYRALELARQVLVPIHKEWDSEDIYRCYYRYAYDLLFESEMGFGWVVCPKCKTMYGRSYNEGSQVRKKCSDVFPATSCDGILRLLSWEDLKPNTARATK